MNENSGGPTGSPEDKPADMDISEGDKDLVDNNTQKRVYNFENKYKSSDTGPYFVYVEHAEKNIGRLFPIKVGHYLFHCERFKNDVLDIKPVGFNRVKVIFKTGQIANALINHRIVKENGLVAYIPEYYTHRKGVIRMVDTQFSEEDLKSAIVSSQKVIEVKRMVRKVIKPDNTIEYKPRQVIVVTFLGNSLPQSVKINVVNFQVTNYIYPVVQCFNCYRYGHTSKLCRGNTRCRSCPKSHNGDNSDDVCVGVGPYCVHCNNREHSSTSKDCPEYRKQFNIKKVMASENIAFKEAETIVNNPSYSKIVTNNRFSVLNTVENFPPLPTPKAETQLPIRKPVRQPPARASVSKRKAVSPVNISPRDRKRRPLDDPSKSGSESVLPNPYRDEFIRHQEKLICQISTFVSNIIKGINPDHLAQNTFDLAPKIREYVSTIFSSNIEVDLSSDNESSY